MERVYLDKEQVVDYISESMNSFIQDCVVVNDAKYHHNSDYTSAVSILKNNILSLDEMNRQRVRRFSKEFLNVMDDRESHVNGSDGISLAVVGLTDLHEDELEYDPFNSHHVDFVIDSDVRASRTSVHYGNEYIAREMIPTEMIRAVDVRIVKYIEMLMSRGKDLDDESVFKLVQKYNCIRNIAMLMMEDGIDIPLREMSYGNCSALDIEMVASSPKLVLKG